VKDAAEISTAPRTNAEEVLRKWLNDMKVAQRLYGEVRISQIAFEELTNRLDEIWRSDRVIEDFEAEQEQLEYEVERLQDRIDEMEREKEREGDEES